MTGAGRPLDGLTILDLSRVLSGPYCTMLAADMGARVIKIEHPVRGDDTRAWGPPYLEGESTYYLSINRNKESVAVDFKTPEGRAIVDALLSRADVVVENFRPGTLDAIGLGYDAVSAAHPRIVYVSISGYGQTGPRRKEPGYDAVAQAEGGLMSITGTPDGDAVRVGVAVGDIAAGMFAFQGMLLALVALGRTGRGQRVDVSLLDAMASLLTYQASRFFGTGEAPTRAGNRHLSIAPYDTFDAADGVLVLAVGTDGQFQACCRVLGLDDLASDTRFLTNDSRVAHYSILRQLLTPAIGVRRVGTLVPALRGEGVPCGAVRSIDEVFADPQLAARDMMPAVTHPTIGEMHVLGVPVKLSSTPGDVRTAPPRLGEHTARVLGGDLGYDETEIARLRDKGVIRSL